MTPSPLHCPYCRSEFPEQATVCAACTRDIAPFVSLIKQVQALTDRVQEIEEASLCLNVAHTLLVMAMAWIQQTGVNWSPSRSAD